MFEGSTGLFKISNGTACAVVPGIVCGVVPDSIGVAQLEVTPSASGGAPLPVCCGTPVAFCVDAELTSVSDSTALLFLPSGGTRKLNVKV